MIGTGSLGICRDVHVMKGEWSAWGGRDLKQHKERRCVVWSPPG